MGTQRQYGAQRGDATGSSYLNDHDDATWHSVWVQRQTDSRVAVCAGDLLQVSHSTYRGVEVRQLRKDKETQGQVRHLPPMEVEGEQRIFISGILSNTHSSFWHI